MATVIEVKKPRRKLLKKCEYCELFHSGTCPYLRKWFFDGEGNRIVLLHGSCCKCDDYIEYIRGTEKVCGDCEDENDNGVECKRCHTTWCEEDEDYKTRLLWDSMTEEGVEICRGCVGKEGEDEDKICKIGKS
jgi:hypothetical protein